MKHITVHKVILRPDAFLSPGVGFDDQGVVVDFIGHTSAMTNINKSIDDHEAYPFVYELPSIYLEAWQEV